MAKSTLGQGMRDGTETVVWLGNTGVLEKKKKKTLILQSVMPIAFTGDPPHTRQSLFGEVSEESSPLSGSTL